MGRELGEGGRGQSAGRERAGSVLGGTSLSNTNTNITKGASSLRPASDLTARTAR